MVGVEIEVGSSGRVPQGARLADQVASVANAWHAAGVNEAGSCAQSVMVVTTDTVQTVGLRRHGWRVRLAQTMVVMMMVMVALTNARVTD